MWTCIHTVLLCSPEKAAILMQNARNQHRQSASARWGKGCTASSAWHLFERGAAACCSGFQSLSLSLSVLHAQ